MQAFSKQRWLAHSHRFVGHPFSTCVYEVQIVFIMKMVSNYIAHSVLMTFFLSLDRLGGLEFKLFSLRTDMKPCIPFTLQLIYQFPITKGRGGQNATFHLSNFLVSMGLVLFIILAAELLIEKYREHFSYGNAFILNIYHRHYQ